MPVVVLLLLALAAVQAQTPPAAGMPPVSGTPAPLLTLRYIDIAPGTGALATGGKRYTVHYTGWFADGTKFDSSLDRNEPLSFVQGRRQVIAGWDIGFEGMKVGGKRRLFIPYQLAYGEQGTSGIPAKAELIFDVELLGVADPPTVPPSVDVLLTLNDLESRIMAMAKATPADKFAWRPVPSLRSFAEIYAHIANANEVMLGLAEEDIKPADFDQKLKDKAYVRLPPDSEIVTRLADSFAALHKAVDTGRAGYFGGEAELFGKPTVRRGIFVWLEAALGEQLGQLEAYARINGILLPWTPGQLQ